MGTSVKQSQFDQWTADELLAELRRRARRGVAKGTRGLRAPRGGRARELDAIPTGKLAQLAQQRQRVIYGVDNRKDVYQVTSSTLRTAANAVVALVKRSDLESDGNGGYLLATQSYRDEYDLCDSEPFASQPIGCFCSGFLVARDVIATAGHCVKSQADLARIRFVFGFRMLDAKRARTVFPARDVYAGTQLLGRQLSDDGTDWALVRLDRPVSGHKPVKVRATGKIGDKQSLFVIGHPSGLPQKYAPRAKVRDNTPAAFFVANLDTYGGNSGSPVFNSSNRVVEGILVRGENDFVSNGSCFVSMVCPTTGCRGEDVTRAALWAAKVPKSGKGAPRAATASKRKVTVKRRKR
jgi:hypothetical protein